MLKKSLAALFVATAAASLLFAAAAYAENLYVRPEGQSYGTGDGSSWANAFSGFASVQWGSGALKVGAGDTLYVSGGSSSAVYAESLSIGASGASGNPIAIKIDTANSSHNGLVTIDPNQASGVVGIDYNANSYVTVDGYNPGEAHQIGIEVTDTLAGSPGVRMSSGASHNTVRYVDVHHTNSVGISLEGDAGYNLVEYVRSHHHYGASGKHGVYFGSDSHNTLQYSELYDNAGQGFHAQNGSDDHLIQYNKIYGNGWSAKDGLVHGIYLGQASNNVVDHNEVYQNAGAGIQIYTTDIAGAHDNVVTYNTSYNNGIDDNVNFGWGIVLGGNVYDTLIERNTFYNNQRHGISLWDSAAEVKYNSLYNNGVGIANGGDLDAYGDGFDSTIDYNFYFEKTNEPLVKWDSVIYGMNDGGINKYKADTGNDAHSVFGGAHYEVSYPSYSWINATTGHNLTGGADEGTVNIALPFDFTFYGVTYTSGTNVKAFQNGAVSFDLTNAALTYPNSYTTTWPSAAGYAQQVIAPWYQDTWNPGGTPKLYTETVGSAPDRKFVIAWNDCQDANGNTLKFELVLYETTNVIEFQYQTLNFARVHMPGINQGDGKQGYRIADANLGSGTAVRFAPKAKQEYMMEFPSYNWISATNAHNLTGGADEGTVDLALPFDFTFYGVKYTSGTYVRAFQNGAISFDLANSALTYPNSYTTTWPSAADYAQQVIAPWYQDTFNPGNPPKLYTETVGSAPNRKFVIAWNDCWDANNNPLNFEVILYESSNMIEFQYKTLNFARTHMPGINKGDGSQGYRISDSGSFLGNYRAVRFIPKQEYVVTYIDYGWVNAATAHNLSGGADEGTVNIALPFDFTFYGVTYTSGTNVKAFQNGAVSFDLTNAALTYQNSYTTTWPSNASYAQQVIAPWYQDTFNPGNPPKLYTETVGSAPNRKFVIAWNDCWDANNNPLKFEIVLYETTNVIEFHYDTLNFARTHMPGINQGDGTNGVRIDDAYIGSGYAVRFTPW